LDGLEDRGNIFVIATTNRPDDIDSALRRPGRFDQTIHMGPPDETGRAAIFDHYLEPLVLDPALDPDRLSSDLASLTPGLTGADISHVCQKAALLCVKEASRIDPPSKNLAISEQHFRQAVQKCTSKQGGKVENEKFMYPIPSTIRQVTVQSDYPARFSRQSMDRKQFQVE